MDTFFEPVRLPGDESRLEEFLCADEWPYHGRSRLSRTQVEAMDFVSDAVASFWVNDADANTVGLVQLLDLDDIGLGAPLFDLRIASEHRRRGFGRGAVNWVVNHLFGEYPELHRIEATTRSDNDGMQRVLAESGFVLEGTLRQTWWSETGEWFDTMVYGILRTDLT